MRIQNVLDKLLEVFRLGGKSILLRKGRASLTVLGIIFGVAAVIAMQSISEGMRFEMLERLKHLGINNILVDSVKPSEQQTSKPGAGGQSGLVLLCYGLLYEDLRMIQANCPWISRIVPVKKVMTDARYGKIGRASCRERV